MNKEQADRIHAAAQAFASAKADAQMWGQIHANLSFVPELEQRFRAAEAKKNSAYADLLNRINEAVTE